MIGFQIAELFIKVSVVYQWFCALHCTKKTRVSHSGQTNYGSLLHYLSRDIRSFIDISNLFSTEYKWPLNNISLEYLNPYANKQHHKNTAKLTGFV